MKHPMSYLFVPAFCLVAIVGTTAMGQDFPLAIEHRFGTTIIPAQPERIATIDYAGADNVLALGFQPLTARAWFGPYDNALWPWAQVFASANPSVLEGDLNFEQIAATNPDIILALRSGISINDYEKLSLIAPVVPVPEGRGDYDLNWIEQAELAGLALGRSDQAAAKIEEVKASIMKTAAAHPEWRGKTFVMMTYWNGSVGVYSETDSTVAFIASLGLAPHPKVTELSSPGEFYITISEEILPELDADVVFWYASADSPDIENLIARRTMRAVEEGREIFLSLNSLTNGALSHGSLISLAEAVERVAPKIEAAIDGDRATEVPLD